jgi:hypothetical protein
MVFVRSRQALFCDLDVMGQHAVTAALGLPELYRHGDARIALAGKHDCQRVGDDRSLDPGVVCEGLCREFLAAYLLTGGQGRLATKLSNGSP